MKRYLVSSYRVSLSRFLIDQYSKSMIESIPEDLKLAITVSLGLFIAFLGLKNAGIIIVSNPFVLVGLGDISDPQVVIKLMQYLSLLGLWFRH